VLKMPDESLRRHGDSAGMWTAGVEINMAEIVLGKRIGAGGFAEVFRGLYHGEVVAVKRLLHKPGPAGKTVSEYCSLIAP
jgi:hypothetical protein